MIPGAAYASDGKDAIVLGWGQLNRSVPNYANTLRYGNVKIIGGPSELRCGAYVPAVDFFRSSMLCAGAPHPSGGSVDTCAGDSGGPLVVTISGVRFLTGITSFGEGCAEVGFPGVDTRVSAIVPWVRNVMKRGY